MFDVAPPRIMNPNQPSREQIEARITALLLGELPAEEAELLRWTISQDAELQKLHGRLLLTVGLVREVVGHPEEASAEKAVPRNLSDERRQKLLAYFKTPRPRQASGELFWLKRIEVRPLVTALALVAVVGVLAVISIPNFVKSRSTSQANATINNLRQLDGAKNEWALENNKSATDVPTPDDLKPYLKEFPKPVMGETYVLGKVSEPVTADVDAKKAKQIGALAIRLPSGGAAGQVVQLSSEGTVTVLSEEERQKQLESVTPVSPVGSPPVATTTPSRPAPAFSTMTTMSTPPPTPTEIILPKSEPTSIESEKGTVYSAQIVGYANSALPATQQAQATPNVALSLGGAVDAGDLFDRQQAKNENAGVVNELARSGGNNGGGNVGGPVTVTFGGAMGGRGASSLQNSAVQARDQSIAVVQLQNGDPQQVAQTLQSMFGNNTVARNGASSSQNSVLQQRQINGVIAMGTTITSSGIGGVSGVGGGSGGFGGGGSGRGGGGGSGGGGRGSGGSAGNPFATLFGGGGGSGDGGGGSSQYNLNGTAGSANITVDPVTHDLVVVADAETQDQIRGVISQIDKPSAQRLVENAPAGRVDSFGVAEPIAAPATPSSDTTLAWNTVAVGRSGTENIGGNRWQVGAPLGPVPSDGIPPAAVAPEARFRDEDLAAASIDVAARQNRRVAQAERAGRETFYRNQAGETSTENELALGDRPATGYAFSTSIAGTPAQATAPARPNGGNNLVGTWTPAAPVVSPPPPASASTPPSTDIADNLASPRNIGEAYARKPESGNGTMGLSEGNTSSHVAGVVANNGTLTTGGSTPVLHANNSLAGELAANQSEAKQEVGDKSALGFGLDRQPQRLKAAELQPSDAVALNDNKFYTGVTRDDANGARFLLQATNAVVVNGGNGVGGLIYMNPTVSPNSESAQAFVSSLGVDLKNSPGKSMAYNDKLGLLFVKGSKQDLDTIENGIQSAKIGAPPQTQMRAQFLENDAALANMVSPSDSANANGNNLSVRAFRVDQAALEKVTSTLPKQPANPSEMITQIVPIRSADARQLVANLASFVSPQATVVANEAGNSIVVTDTRENLKHLSQIIDSLDVPPRRPAATNAPIPQPEFLTRENAFSTFSMNVSDVSFKLAAASLEKGRMPDAASIRSEEFINAFDYRDPEAKWDSASSLSAQTGKMPAPQPIAFASERARYPFAQNRDLLRFSVKTAAAGRAAGRPLNLVLLLDNSGSMERADRVEIIREALRVLAAQLQPQDTVSIVTFARTARLWADGVPGDKAGETLEQVGGITPEGGTNLEEAMRLAYETARRHYLAGGINRVVLLTDGAANLGNVDPGALKQKVEAQRKQGIALDCFGIGWDDYNDNLLAELSGNGDGRYAFINAPEEAGTDFAAKLAGALQVAAQDVKVQVEFNPQRVVSWRQIGYAKHQLTKEQFRDNSVLAAEIAAQEAGNALYTVETKPDGSGPIATVYVRYRIPG
ncbi:MAG: von Willebrand factor type A domain-containing protein, partial [Verrucomicrobiota bacterium]